MLSERGARRYVTALVVLAPLTDWKVGGLQPVELLLLPALFLYGLALVGGGGRLVLRPELRSWLRWYGALVAGVALVSLIASLDVTIFPPSKDLGVLKTAPWLTISRLIQLVAMVFGTLSVAHLCLVDRRLFGHGVRLYAIVGVVLASYGILGFIAAKAGVDNPAVTNVFGYIRARATFVEGGPFGLYLISVIAASRLARAMRVMSLRVFLAMLVVAVAALLLSLSKAAALTLLAMLACEMFFGRLSLAMRVGILLMGLVVAGAAAPVAVRQINGYVAAYQIAEKVMGKLERMTGHGVVFNPFTTLGRVAAAVIVPNMVADRPIFGIGFGNYSLVRNDPTYRAFVPPTVEWDLPGLGLVGYAPEVGLPMMLVLLAVLLRLPWLALRGRVPGALFFCALYPFTAHLMGVQITFFYPWLVTALALCAFYRLRSPVQVSGDMSDLSSPLIHEPPSAPPTTASIDLSALLGMVIRRWWLIGLMVFVGLAAALGVARVVGPSFTASMTVSAQPDSTSSSLASMKSGLLASLSGGSGSQSEDMDHYLAMLKDPSLVARAREHTRLLELLFPRQWDAAHHSWGRPSGLMPWISDTVRGLAGLPPKGDPNDKEIAMQLERRLETTLERGTGYWQIEVTLPHREDALELLNILHHEADDMVREQAQRRAANRIEYINRRLADIRTAEHQRMLLELMSTEERKVILSNADENFSVMVISPPQAGTLPSRPKLALFLLVGILLGGGVGTVVAVWLGLRRRGAQ